MTSEGASGTSKTAKTVILKGDGSLDKLFSRLSEKFKVLWNPKESGYLKEPIGVKGDHRKGVRNVKNCQKGDSQRRQEF